MLGLTKAVFRSLQASAFGESAMVVPKEAMARTARLKQKPPHAFVLDALAPLHPEVRRMFSGFAVYIGDRIVCMLRDHPKSPRDNGVWLVLSEAVNPADRTLRREFPSLRSIELLAGKIGHWLLIPSDGPAFETEALHACDLLLGHDPRLGRIPKSRQ
jgi:hypothetical protein